MSSKAKPATVIGSTLFTILLLLIFSTRNVSASIPLAPKTPTPTSSPTRTATPIGPTPTLITGDLACSTIRATGVTCINYGTYLDYSINITQANGYIEVADFTRNTTAAYLGITTNFVHTVTSTNNRNYFYSQLNIYPYDSLFTETTYDAYVPSPAIQSSRGTTISFTNNYSYWDWFLSYGSQPDPQYRHHEIVIQANSQYPIVSHSVVGNIYIFSNQVTLAGTPPPTLTPTPTVTFTPTFTPANTPTITPTPQDRWYTGNSRHDVYGVKAYISAPPIAPLLVDSGESSYVTTTGSATSLYWIQTGWRYYQGFTLPKRYVEINPPAGYISPYHYDTQNWGDITEYKIVWLSGSQQWCAYIDGFVRNCHDIGIPAPISVNGHSEVHISPQNELNVNFWGVSFMDINNTWSLFDQVHWKEDAPYQVDKMYEYQYHNYGP